MTPDSNKAFIHWSASGEEADKGLHDDFYGMNLLLFDPKVRASCRRKSIVSAGASMCKTSGPPGPFIICHGVRRACWSLAAWRSLLCLLARHLWHLITDAP